MSDILGLSRNPAFEPTRLRGDEYAVLAQASRNRMLANALVAAFVASVFAPLIGLVIVVPWAALLSLILYKSRQTDLLLVDTGQRIAPSALERSQNINSIASSACWVAALLVFPTMADGAQATTMLLVALVLMMSSTFVFSTSPLSVLIYIGILGLGAVVSLALQGEWQAMGGAILFTIASLVATVQVRSTFVKARMAEAAVVEKEAVVSLLLREFEENEADWLWEIDPARRLRSVSPRFAFALAGRRPMSKASRCLKWWPVAIGRAGSFRQACTIWPSG